MGQSLKDDIIHRVRQPLHNYNQSFTDLQETGRDIEKTLESDTSLLAAIRKEFDELARAVESEHQGTSFFNQEIKRTKEHIEKSIEKVSASLAISDQMSEGLYRLAQSFDRIHTDGVQLSATVKNINIVADSIEVASRNAGITAFHAGRQGRGFEVIAREMTTLVRSAQEPITEIPETAQHITQGTEQLGDGLATINNLVDELMNMNRRFSEISGNLLTLIPNVEVGIRAISESVESQRTQHRLLLEENARTAHWLDDLTDMAHTTAILEISLETLYRHVNNLRGNLLTVADESNFKCMYDALRIALHDASKRFEKIDRELRSKELMSMDVESSEQWILQLGSSSNQLFQIVKKISDEITVWIETNRLASQVLGEGVSFYESIAGHLSGLNKQLAHLKGTVENLEEPLYDLKRITDRSKVLGLYAGIESARGGDFAPSLTVVTREIKDLSGETTTFVEKLNELTTDMSDSFLHLSEHLTKSMGDVEQGLSYLQSAIEILDENKGILDELNRYAQGMIESTETMTDHCNALTEYFQQLNKDHQRISHDFNRYAQTVSQSARTAEEVLDVMDHYDKDVAILEKKASTVIFRQALEPIVLDPANKTDAWSHEVIEQIFTGLVTFDSSNHLVPGLADFFSVSQDGRTWDFTIKKSARFHNGDEVTAYDVAATISRVMSSTNVNFIDYVDDVTVLDERRVRFTLKFPFLPFLANLACGVCDITAKDFSSERPIGAGPYRLVHWDKNNEIILEAFDEFSDGRPPIDRVIFKIIGNNKEAVARFKKGEITMMRLTPDTVKYVEPDQIVTGPGLKTQYLGIQVTHDTPFKDKRVRQAMNHAIDKMDYVQVVMEGQAVPGYGVLPPGMEAYNESLVGYHRNLDRARTLMTEAGYPHGLEGTFPLDVSDSEVSITRAEYLKESLAKIGIAIEINPMPWKDFLEKGYRGESLLAMRGWVSDNGDPDNFLYPLFHSTSFGRPGNTSFYQSDEADRLIEQARAERNSAKRNSMYQRIEELIVEDAPWIFLCHGVDSYAVAKNVHGFQIDPFGLVRFRYLWST